MDDECLWSNLLMIYKRIKEKSPNNDDYLHVSKAIQIGDEKHLPKKNIHLLGGSIICLLGKVRAKENVKITNFCNNLITVEAVHNLLNVLCNHVDQYLVYCIKEILLTVLFKFPAASSQIAQSCILSHNSITLTSNCNIVDILRDILCYKDELSLDKDINKIKYNIVHSLVSWKHILNPTSGNCNKYMQHIILDIWCYILSSPIQLMSDTVLIKYADKLFQLSYCSVNVCFKFVSVLNKILSQHAEVTNVSYRIIVSKSVVTALTSNWLNKIPQEVGNYKFNGIVSYEEDICITYFCNVVLTVLKSLNILINSNENICKEQLLNMLKILNKWLLKQQKNNIFMPNQVLLVQLFINQDDQLLEMMISYLNIYIWVQNVETTSGITSKDELERLLNPHIMFLKFISSLKYDYSVLLDFLTSNETCFLLYMLKYLKLVKLEWQDFVQAHELVNDGTSDVNIHTTMKMMMKLHSTIEKLVDKNLFPYNVQPLLQHLNLFIVKNSAQVKYNSFM